jgi:hypothetical protein
MLFYDIFRTVKTLEPRFAGLRCWKVRFTDTLTYILTVTSRSYWRAHNSSEFSADSSISELNFLAVLNNIHNPCSNFKTDEFFWINFVSFSLHIRPSAVFLLMSIILQFYQ